MQYLVIFYIKYNIFIQNKGILNINHDYACYAKIKITIIYMGLNYEENPFIMGVFLN